MIFKGKNALVTGSSRGIGRGIALKLAEKGARVAVHSYRHEDAAQATWEKIRELGSSGFIVQADVCRPDEIRRMFQQVRSEFGSLDLFVSNARTEASTFYQAPMEITLDQWNTAGFAGQSLPGGGSGSRPDDGRWGKNRGHHVCARRAIWQLAALGCDGRGKSGDGSVSALFRGRIGQPRHHHEHYQSGMDGRQRVKQLARSLPNPAA